MTNKQHQAHSEPEEKQNQELLFRRFKLMDEVVETVRKANINAGLDTKHMNSFVDWPEFFQKKNSKM